MIIGCVGDGVKIDFSVRVILFLGWSPKTHTLTRGSVIPNSLYRKTEYFFL